LAVAVRQELVAAGARDTVARQEVQRLLERAPIREIKLVPRIDDPSISDVPAALAGAFGPSRPLTLKFWRSLRTLDRHVLMMFVNNTRLLWRALAEIALRNPQGLSVLPARGWTGTVAHCEVKTTPEIVLALNSPRFLDGRACILARVAGIRAARWASEILDFHAAVATGPVEVGHFVDPTRRPGYVVWQAHVSTIEGQFSPSASMLAAVTAATALHDIITRASAYATIENARLADEPWLHHDMEDEVTVGI
jgi:molybdenum cofactor biosynthesis enzyme